MRLVPFILQDFSIYHTVQFSSTTLSHSHSLLLAMPQMCHHLSIALLSPMAIFSVDLCTQRASRVMTAVFGMIRSARRLAVRG